MDIKFQDNFLFESQIPSTKEDNDVDSSSKSSFGPNPMEMNFKGANLGNFNKTADSLSLEKTNEYGFPKNEWVSSDNVNYMSKPVDYHSDRDNHKFNQQGSIYSTSSLSGEDKHHNKKVYVPFSEIYSNPNVSCEKQPPSNESKERDFKSILDIINSDDNSAENETIQTRIKHVLRVPTLKIIYKSVKDHLRIPDDVNKVQAESTQSNTEIGTENSSYTQEESKRGWKSFFRKKDKAISNPVQINHLENSTPVAINPDPIKEGSSTEVKETQDTHKYVHEAIPSSSTSNQANADLCDRVCDGPELLSNENKKENRINQSVSDVIKGSFRKKNRAKNEFNMISQELKLQINNFQIAGYASQYFNNVRVGIFRRTIPIQELLVWTPEQINHPLLKSSNKVSKKALNIFKILQIFMDDKEPKMSWEYKKYQVFMLLDTVSVNYELSDEVYCQICKQLTANPNPDSVELGWKLMIFLLHYFAPTNDLEGWLLNFIAEYVKKNPQYEKYKTHIFEKLGRFRSGLISTFRVPDIEEIELVFSTPLESQLFGITLAEVMENQKKHNYSIPGDDKTLPAIMVYLISACLKYGNKSEGIMRIPGSVSDNLKLKMRFESGDYNISIVDPYVISSTLKIWLSQLKEPLIPMDLYNDCIEAVKKGESEILNIIETIPALNLRVIRYLISFLKILLKPQNAIFNRMTAETFSIVFSPNILRYDSNDINDIFHRQKYEQKFVLYMIKNIEPMEIIYID